MTDDFAPMPEDWQRALAIVAHPDDLEYGAAGAIATWTAAGRDISYLLVSRGEAGIDTVRPEKCAALREAEQRASAAEVGVHTVEFLDHPDGVIEYSPALRRDLALAIRRHRPELVITLNHHAYFSAGNWNSADHRAVGRAVIDAVSDAGNRWIFPDLAEQDVQPWKARWVAVAGSPQASHAVDITETLDRAVASLLCHRTYLEALSDTPPEQQARDFLHRVAQDAGTRFGGRLATAFELIG